MAGSNKRRRPRQSLVRWSDEEFNAAASKADGAGLALAAFVRAATLGDAGPRAQRRPPADHVALRQILGQLGKIGSNINQIARALNMAGQPDLPELKTAIRAILQVCNAILQALGKKSDPGP